MLDVFMLTFGEPEADDNFAILQEKAPHAKRIDGIEGLLNAHKACAKESRTSYFYVCDADAVIQENFAFKFTPSDRREAYPGVKETECVFTYRSHNPINDLIYGYGGVKLFPKKNLLAVDEFKVDMTTSIGAKFNAAKANIGFFLTVLATPLTAPVMPLVTDLTRLPSPYNCLGCCPRDIAII